MTQPKPEMSGSYKAIFAFSIFMVIFTFFAGAAAGPGRGVLGVLAWGYTAWLMHKRKNKDLVALQKVLLGFYGIVTAIVFFGFFQYGPELAGDLGIPLGGWLFLIGISAALAYSLLRYFQRQLALSDSPNAPYANQDAPAPAPQYATADQSTPADHTNESDPLRSGETPMTQAANEEPSEHAADPYQQAGEEVLSGKVDAAIWARALVEGGGIEGAVKAAYVKLRVAQLEAKAEAAAKAEAKAKVWAEEQKGWRG